MRRVSWILTIPIVWCIIIAWLLLVHYRWNRGDYRFPRRLSLCLSVRLSVRPSVCPSVSALGVRPFGFPNFSQPSFQILTWNLVYGFVMTWYRSSSTFVLFGLFYWSYYPLQKFSFPNFSLLSFVIFIWNLEYEFVLTRYKSSSTFVAFDVLLHELLSFA